MIRADSKGRSTGWIFHALKSFLLVMCVAGLATTSADPVGGVCADGSLGAHEVVGITVPSRVATLSAVLPARIRHIAAAEGQVVKEGIVVVDLEDSVQQAKTRLAGAGAASTLETELAHVRWQRANREWDRLSRLHGDDHASSKEFSDALAEVESRRLEHELTIFHRDQAGRVYERERCLLNEFHLKAPFSGYVSKHLKQDGESVDRLEGIVTIVQLDPIEVLVDCPLKFATLAMADKTVWVQPVDPNWPGREGRIVVANRVADGASQTFRTRIRVSNKGNEWFSGLKVVVDFCYASGKLSQAQRGQTPTLRSLENDSGK